MISEGGHVANGIRALTGVPVFVYETKSLKSSDGTLDAMWTNVLEGETNNWIMGAGTNGSGDDSATNQCGIAKSHAYSIISAFTMTDASSVEHKMLLMRNPWG